MSKQLDNYCIFIDRAFAAFVNNGAICLETFMYFSNADLSTFCRPDILSNKNNS